MAVTEWPRDALIKQTTFCALCGERKNVEEVTAGMVDNEGNQMFACIEHTANTSQLIIGWADARAVMREEVNRLELEELLEQNNV